MLFFLGLVGWVVPLIDGEMLVADFVGDPNEWITADFADASDEPLSGDVT